MSFHGRLGEAWADWLAGYQRLYPPVVPGLVREQAPIRCGLRPPPEIVCPTFGMPHRDLLGGCECVIFKSPQGHRRHRALCGAVWEG